MPFILNTQLLSCVFSFYTPKQRLKIVAINKRIQRAMNISIEHYKMQSSFRYVIKPTDNFLAYFDYYNKYYKVKEYKDYLYYYLCDYAKTNFIYINFSYFFENVKYIRDNCILTITSTKNILPLKLLFPSIVGVEITIDSIKTEEIEMIFDNVIPNTIEYFTLKFKRQTLNENNESETLMKRLIKMDNLKKINIKRLPFISLEQYEKINNINKIESIGFEFIRFNKKEREVLTGILKKINHLKEIFFHFYCKTETFNFLSLLSHNKNTITSITIFNIIIKNNTNFSDFPNLTSLSIKNSTIQFLSGLERIYSLKKLKLKYTIINILSLIKVIENNPLLETIKLESNTLTKENNNYIIRLGKTLSTLKMLNKIKVIFSEANLQQLSKKLDCLLLNLTNNSITDLTIGSIVNNYYYCLEHFPNLISLQFNGFTQQKQKVPNKEVKFNYLQLQNLSLSNCFLTEFDIKSYLFKCTNLTNLSLIDIKINIHLIYTLVKNIKKFKFIKKYFMDNVMISFNTIDFSNSFRKELYQNIIQCPFLEVFIIKNYKTIGYESRKPYQVPSLLIPELPFLKEFQFFEKNILYLIYEETQFSSSNQCF